VSAASDTALAQALRGWLPGRRWYAGRGHNLTSLDVVTSTTLRAGDPELRHIVVRVESGDRSAERYQVLVGLRAELPDRLAHAAIGPVDGRQAYEATADTELTAVLLEGLAAGAVLGSVRFEREPGVELDTSQTSRVSTAEQSNTSLVYGEAYILKLFRRLSEGLNPDLEVHRALASVGCEHIAVPLGAITAHPTHDAADADDADGFTYAMLQGYVANAADGWQMAITSVRDLYAEGDLHADEVGGDFAGEASRLGSATAQVHHDLAEALGAHTANSQEAAATAQQMRDRLALALTVVPQLLPFAEALRTAYDEIAGSTDPVPVQRVHGDLHLGQALRSMQGWVLLDFEGEPARPFAERRALMSPLRDVAGMLRSFDYAARHLLAGQSGADTGHLTYRANEWAERNRDAFCTGYAQVAGVDPRDRPVLLRAFELDKAVYEAVYETDHRPSWLPIPLDSIARLAG